MTTVAKAGRILQKLQDICPSKFRYRDVDFILQNATQGEINFYYHWFFEIYEEEKRCY